MCILVIVFGKRNKICAPGPVSLIGNCVIDMLWETVEEERVSDTVQIEGE